MKYCGSPGLHISLVRLRLTTFRCLPLLSLSRTFCVYIYIYSYIYNIYVYIYVLYRYLFHTQKSFAQMGSQVPSIGTVKLSSLDLGRRRIDPTRRGAVEQRGRHCVTYGGEGLFFPQRCGHDFLLWWDGLVFFLVNSCFRVRKRKTREEEIDSRKNKFL